jgi:HEAT repeat protein
VCVLVAAAAVGAQEPEPRPRVEPVWQALRATVRGTAERDAQLRAALDQLRTVDEMRRALLLNLWRDHDPDEALAAVDARHRAALVERFERAVRATLRQDDDARRVALKMIGELDPRLPGKGPEPLTRDFTGDLAELTRIGPAPLREAAARTLGRINPEPTAAAAALGAMLKDPDPRLRAVAGEALTLMVTTALRLEPSRVSREGNHQEAIRATCAAVPIAAAGLGDTSAGVRRRCAEALGCAAEALSDLVADAPAAEDIEDWQVHQHAIEAEREAVRPLGVALRDQTPALARASGDADARVRILARHALEHVAEARARLLRRASSAVAPPAGQGDAASATRSATFLLEDPLLAGLRQALPALAAGLEDADVEGRRAAIDVLEVMGRQAAPAAPALVNALSDRDRFVRWAAARALGKIRPADAEAAVAGLARLLGENDGDLRLAAAAALSAYGPAARAAGPALVAAAQSAEPELRLAALRALESLGSNDAAAVAVLSAALSDGDARVRQVAAEALEKLGPSRSEAVNALLRPSPHEEGPAAKAVGSVRPR